MYGMEYMHALTPQTTPMQANDIHVGDGFIVSLTSFTKGMAGSHESRTELEALFLLHWDWDNTSDFQVGAGAHGYQLLRIASDTYSGCFGWFTPYECALVDPLGTERARVKFRRISHCWSIRGRLFDMSLKVSSGQAACLTSDSSMAR